MDEKKKLGGSKKIRKNLGGNKKIIQFLEKDEKNQGGAKKICNPTLDIDIFEGMRDKSLF